MAQRVRTALALSCIVMAPSALWYYFPRIPSRCIGTFSEALTSFKAWFTPPLLFLLMNVVVLALAFSSGIIKQKPLNMLDGEELEDLRKTRSCKTTEDDMDGEDQEEEVEGEDFRYPVVLRSFFGDGGHVVRRKTAVKHCVSAERKGRSSYSSLSLKLNPSPSLVANPSTKPAHVSPKTATFALKKPVSSPISGQASGGDRDVDERADAFIGGFYKKMKLEQVDPYRERLERSYGR